MKRVAITVHGTVQNVFFRMYAKDEADRLELSGFARNEPDGSVYIEAEGAEDALGLLLEWCRKGSPRAVVDRVEHRAIPVTNQLGFSIY